MPLPIEFYNWRFNPFTGVFNPKSKTETHTIQYWEESNAYGIILDETPQNNTPSTTTITGYTEVPHGSAPSALQFRVDYAVATNQWGTAFVEFNSSRNGQTVTVSYKGLGTSLKAIYVYLLKVVVQAAMDVWGKFVAFDDVETKGTTTLASGTGASMETVGPAEFRDTVGIDGDVSMKGAVRLAENSGAEIFASGKTIQEVADPVEAQDAVTLNYLRDKFLYVVGWKSVKKPETQIYVALAYGNSVFVAVSLDGTTRTMRSTDNGASWSAVAAAEANTWRSVAFGNGVFVAVAYSGTNRTMRSTDNGASWSAVAAAEANTWVSIAYGNGVFVAVSQDGTNRVMRSTNYGVSWSAVAAAAVASWSSVAYGGGVFIAVADDNQYTKNTIMRSTDNGASWAIVDIALPFSPDTIVYTDNGEFIIASAWSFAISRDLGVTWDILPVSTVAGNFSAMAVGANGRIVGIGSATYYNDGF